MKKRFTDQQIISILKEQESGERTSDVCRRHGISQQPNHIFALHEVTLTVKEQVAIKVVSKGHAKVCTLTTHNICSLEAVFLESRI